MTNMISKIFLSISSFSRKAGNRLSSESDKTWRNLLAKWHREDKEKQFRTNYNKLDSSSIVFDLGGYEGQWASDIFSQYLCAIHVFEPHPKFAKAISNRFDNNKQVTIYDFGLSAEDQQVTFSTDADSTSMFKKGNDSVEVQLKCAQTFLTNNSIDYIHLMKINIEGGEYDLLEHLIDTDYINNIQDIQVQFHHFVPKAKERMLAIQKKLEKTHKLTYQFEFFWENWTLKNPKV